MVRMRQVLAGALTAGMILGMCAPVTAESLAESQTESQTESVSGQTEGDLQKENEELRAQLEAVMKELEELKGRDGQEEKGPELPENVANADTTVQYTDRGTVKIVQETLNAAGYNCGTPDGVAGAKTTEQINAYETAQGLTVNGVITDQLLESLGLAEKLEEQARIEAEKASYSADYTYEQLARNPDTYTGSKVKFSGQVLQVMEGTTNSLRVAINSNYETVIYVYFEGNKLSYRLLEDDMITVYGIAQGVYSYETVRGDTITIPLVEGDIIELQ